MHIVTHNSLRPVLATGKTYLTRNLAHSLVGEQNVLEVACAALRSDADLFGATGAWEGDGRLTAFLRTRQECNSIVFLDEFEKARPLPLPPPCLGFN